MHNNVLPSQRIMLDFGPLSSFWCFPYYECYNGILEGINKSWIAPEKQTFMKFWGLQYLRQLSVLNESGGDFLSSAYKSERNTRIKLSWTNPFSRYNKPATITNISGAVANVNAVKSPYQCLIPAYKEKCFCDYELSYLQDVYSMIYPQLLTTNISRMHCEFKKCVVNNEESLSSVSSSRRSCTN